MRNTNRIIRRSFLLHALYAETSKISGDIKQIRKQRWNTDSELIILRIKLFNLSNSVLLAALFIMQNQDAIG
jgi:hypothetical protein